MKGCDVLVAAAPKIVKGIGDGRSVRFLMVGDGPQRDILVSQAGDLGVGERFSFLGFRGDVPRLLSASDLLAMPSRNEGLGMSILEAMALSLPVVASRVGGIPEVVTDDVTGILVSPEQPDELARACLALLEDRGRAREMGRAGRKAVEERFSIELSVERTARLYLDLMGEAS